MPLLRTRSRKASIVAGGAAIGRSLGVGGTPRQGAVRAGPRLRVGTAGVAPGFSVRDGRSITHAQYSSHFRPASIFQEIARARVGGQGSCRASVWLGRSLALPPGPVVVSRPSPHQAEGGRTGSHFAGFLGSTLVVSLGFSSKPRMISTCGRAFFSFATPASVTLVCHR